MVLENNPSARMQVRSRGQLVAPACCCVCGNATCDEGYLDLGAYVDFHGTLYLCMLCITQGAETCGMFTPQEVKHLQDQIEALLAEKETLTSELTDANTHISNFDNLMRTAFGTSDVLNPPASEGVPEATDGSASGEPTSEESVTFFEPEPVSGTQLRNIAFE